MTRAAPAATVAAWLCLAAAAQDAPLSPACALLTPAQAAELFGTAPTLSDDSAAFAGLSSCEWTDGQTASGLSASLMRPAAYPRETTEAAFDADLAAAAESGSAEPLPDLGDAAFLSEAHGFIAITLRKGEAILAVTSLGLARDKVIHAARLMAEQLDGDAP